MAWPKRRRNLKLWCRQAIPLLSPRLLTVLTGAGWPRVAWTPPFACGRRTAAAKSEDAIQKASTEGKEPPSDDVAKWRTDLEKGAEILLLWMQRPSVSVGAVRAIQVGEMFAKLGRHDRARSIFAELWKKAGGDQKFAQREGLEILYAKSLLELARADAALYREAEPLLAELYDVKCVQPGKKDEASGRVSPKLVPNLMLLYAACLGGILDQEKDGSWHRDDGLKKFDKALEIYSEVVTRHPDKSSNEWLEAKCGAALMVYKQGDSEKAKTIVINLDRLYRPVIDRSKLKPKFEYLKKLFLVDGN